MIVVCKMKCLSHETWYYVKINYGQKKNVLPDAFGEEWKSPVVAFDIIIWFVRSRCKHMKEHVQGKHNMNLNELNAMIIYYVYFLNRFLHTSTRISCKFHIICIKLVIYNLQWRLMFQNSLSKIQYSKPTYWMIDSNWRLENGVEKTLRMWNKNIIWVFFCTSFWLIVGIDIEKSSWLKIL